MLSVNLDSLFLVVNNLMLHLMLQCSIYKYFKNNETLTNHGDLTSSSPVEFVPHVIQLLSVLLDHLLLVCCQVTKLHCLKLRLLLLQTRHCVFLFSLQNTNCLGFTIGLRYSLVIQLKALTLLPHCHFRSITMISDIFYFCRLNLTGVLTTCTGLWIKSELRIFKNKPMTWVLKCVC